MQSKKRNLLLWYLKYMKKGCNKLARDTTNYKTQVWQIESESIS